MARDNIQHEQLGMTAKLNLEKLCNASAIRSIKHLHSTTQGSLLFANKPHGIEIYNISSKNLLVFVGCVELKRAAVSFYAIEDTEKNVIVGYVCSNGLVGLQDLTTMTSIGGTTPRKVLLDPALVESLYLYVDDAMKYMKWSMLTSLGK